MKRLLSVLLCLATLAASVGILASCSEVKMSDDVKGAYMTVYIDDVAAAALKRYFAARKDDSVALFASRSSERLTDNGVRTMMKQIEKKTGVPNIHPHRFRRTLATSLSKKGMPVEEIAMILGHEDVRTTMKYICKDKATVKHHYQTIVA